MKSPTRLVFARAAPGDRGGDQGGSSDADQSGDQVDWIEIAVTEEQLRGFVRTGDGSDKQRCGQGESAFAGKVGKQGQHAEQNCMADFIAKSERNCRQQTEEVFPVTKVRRQRDGEQHDGKAGENKMAGAHRKGEGEGEMGR